MNKKQEDTSHISASNKNTSGSTFSSSALNMRIENEYGQGSTGGVGHPTGHFP